MGLVASALVAGLTIVQVYSAEELLTAIGPQRTIRLAPGSYDLRGVTPRTLEFVEWKESLIKVHDVDALTIEGPAGGEARLTAASSVELQFENVRDLTLRRFGIGPALDDPIPGFRRSRGFIRQISFEKFEGLVVEEVQSNGASFGGISLREGRHAAFRRVTLGAEYGITAWQCSDLRVEDSWLKTESGALSLGEQLRDVVISHTTIFSPMAPDPEIDQQVLSRPDTTGRLIGVRLIDEITGKLRRTIADQALPLPSGPSSSGSLDVPFVIVRRGAWHAESAAPTQWATLRLEDGREPMKDFPAAFRYGLDPITAQVRRLGSSSGPVEVTWYDQPQGNGAYTNFYYRILKGHPGGGVLLAGAFGASGHQGAGSGGSESRTFSFEGGFLTVRGMVHGVEAHQPPGLPLEQEDEEGTVFSEESTCAYELIYRMDGDHVVPVRFEEYSRIEPRTDVAAMIAKGARASWPHLDGTPPRIGEWLKTILPLKQGAEKYPLIDLKMADAP